MAPVPGRPTRSENHDKGKMKVESCKMVGLWGRSSFEIDFDPHINFIIGDNGTGKTSVINFLNSCLSVDFFNIQNTPFSSFTVVLKNYENNVRCSIQIETIRDSDKIRIAYRPDLNVDHAERENVRRSSSIYNPLLPGLHSGTLLGAPSDGPNSELARKIRNLSTVTWLPVHRSDSSRRGVSGSSLSPVDQRLELIEKNFSEYVTEILSKTKSENEEFQKKVFLSFLEPRDPRSLNKLRTTDVESLTSHLRMAFRHLEISQDEYEAPLKRYRDRLRTALPRDDQKQVGRSSLAKEVNLISLLQVNDIIEKWKQYQGTTSSLFTDINKVMTIFSSYFKPKKMSFTQGGEVIFYVPNPLDNGPLRRIKPSHLSSGEKQLFILIMESLLQKNRENVYLADEPELSLHVNWQEKLVESIIDINPQVQIIFATHSPDIVGPFQNKIIDMTNFINSASSID